MPDRIERDADNRAYLFGERTAIVALGAEGMAISRTTTNQLLARLLSSEHTNFVSGGRWLFPRVFRRRRYGTCYFCLSRCAYSSLVGRKPTLLSSSKFSVIRDGASQARQLLFQRVASDVRLRSVLVCDRTAPRPTRGRDVSRPLNSMLECEASTSSNMP
jgi:hypothetical protein